LLDDQLIEGYHPQDLSDYQLIALLESRTYMAEMGALLRKELERREIDAEHYKALKQAFNEPLFSKTGNALPWWLKLVLAIIPFHLLHVISAQSFRHYGYERRWRQCWRLFMVNLVFWAFALHFLAVRMEW